MKIYQIHEYRGSYEDFSDYIRFTYLDSNKAQLMKSTLEIQENIARKCDNCPLWNCPNNCVNDCRICDNSYSINLAKEYCSKCDIAIDEDDEMICINKTIHYDDSEFEIKEVDVIE